MKNSTGMIVGIVVVVLIIIGAVAYHRNYSDETLTSATTSQGQAGNVYVGVTDASADIKNVNDIDMSIKKVEIYSVATEWVTLSSDPQMYSLLALKSNGSIKLFAKADIAPGTYNKIRVTLGDTTVHTKANGDVVAILPASQIVMNADIVVKENENTHIKLDFLADKSLHATSDGKFVFAPVVKAEARSNADVSVAGDDTVTEQGGSVDSNTSVGVDLDGSSRQDFELSTDSSLKVNAPAGGTIDFILNGKTFHRDDSMQHEDEIQSDSRVTTPTINVNGGLNGNVNSDSGKTKSDTQGSGGVKLNLY